MRRNLVVAAAAALLSASSAFAHVFWLQPSTFTPRAGELVKLQLRVGDVFPGDSLPRDEQRIVKFDLFAPGDDAAHPIVGRDGRDPAGLVKIANAGTYVLAYQSKPSPVTLPAEKFEAYLKEKGLEKIIEARARAGETDQPAREVFSRCAKAIVRVAGEASATGTAGDSTSPKKPDNATRSTGLRFEILPLADPTTLKVGEALPMRLNFEGKPLANALVEARSPVADTTVVRVRTNEKGEATLTLTTPGMWVIDSVEMVRASRELEADWESVWASLCISVMPGSNDAANTRNTDAKSRSAAADTTTALTTGAAPTKPGTTTKEDRR